MLAARQLELSAVAATPVVSAPVVVVDVTTSALTRREREVLTLVAAGSSTRGIAQQLSISPNTVETHVRAAREKLGARTRMEAAARAALVGDVTSTCKLRCEQRRLLELLAAGETLGEAARHLALSRRTADRRLSQARGELGVASTAEAVLAVQRMAQIGDAPPPRTVVASR